MRIMLWLPEESAERSSRLASNQGLYNSFFTIGLICSLSADHNGFNEFAACENDWVNLLAYRDPGKTN